MNATLIPQQVLALPMGENDARAATIRDYLIALLATLWDEKDGFDGKRPFGNSDWDGDLVVALIQASAIEGELDEDGYINTCDDGAAEELIAGAIQTLGTPAGEAGWQQAEVRGPRVADVPAELALMLDEDAGKKHSASGPVMASPARILARHEQMLRRQIADAIADADDACGAPVCGCCGMQRDVSVAIARGVRQ